RESYKQGRDETAQTYLDLACEHLDVANANAALLLDAPGPDDALIEGIELAQPTASPDVLFMQRVLALSMEIYRETDRPIAPWALDLVSSGLSALAQEGTDESADQVFLRLLSEIRTRAEFITGQLVTTQGIEDAIAMLGRELAE